MMFCQIAIPITESSQIGEARRTTNRIGAEIGLGKDECGKAAIVATELATNLVRHANRGELLLRSYKNEQAVGIELLSIDRGPGMFDLVECLKDGFSTGGTPGTGLGAVQRLSAEFDVYSAQPQGTVVMSRIEIRNQFARERSGFLWGVINRPAPHEELSGDTWRIAERSGGLSIMVADGLGHGPLAAEAAAEAACVFEEAGYGSLTDYFALADRRMRGTRGAAVAVAHFDSDAGVLRYAGVGNISGSLRSIPQTNGKGLLSHNGTVGVEMRKVQQIAYDFDDQSLLVMHSDGLQSRWSLEPYPGLIHRHPSVIAGVLYRDFTRGRDDVTVGVIRTTSRQAPNRDHAT